ncbi:hypothetical protein Tco_0581193 [Tanacetum coccineum]
MRYSLAIFIAKRMEFVMLQPRIILPYGMLLTHLYNHFMSNFPKLSSDRYVLYDLVMYPLAPQHEPKIRKDYATKRGRHSTSSSSSSALDHPSSSHNIDDDNDEDDEVFTNPPHNEQNIQTLFTRQTKILNRRVQIRDEREQAKVNREGHQEFMEGKEEMNNLEIAKNNFIMIGTYLNLLVLFSYLLCFGT